MMFYSILNIRIMGLENAKFSKENNEQKEKEDELLQFKKLEIEANIINSNPKLLNKIYRTIPKPQEGGQKLKKKSASQVKVQKLVACIEQKPLENIFDLEKENKQRNKRKKLIFFNLEFEIIQWIISI